MSFSNDFQLNDLAKILEVTFRWLTGLRRMVITDDRPLKWECECVRIPHELAWAERIRTQAFSF